MPASEKRTEYGISMWGAPGSGKTTFLAALNIALTRWGKDWKVIGADEASTQKLISLTTSLTRDQAFPRATSGIDDFRWLLVGKVPRSRPKLFRSVQYMETIKIALDLADPSGEIASPEMAEHGQRTDLIDYLERSRGIVFIFDPIRESEVGDTFDHTFGVLAQLAQQMAGSPEFSEGRLPHYVAVCITKFDEIRVFRTAEKLNLLVTDPDDPLDLPRVAEDDARELFARLCDVSQTDNAVMVFNTLEQYFRRDRIKYFVTSAVGFFVDPRKGAYDPDDIQNLLPGPDATPKRLRIRGTVHPINVMEPVLWLGKKLAGVPDE